MLPLPGLPSARRLHTLDGKVGGLEPRSGQQDWRPQIAVAPTVLWPLAYSCSTVSKRCEVVGEQSVLITNTS